MQLCIRVLSFRGESFHEEKEVSIGSLGGCIGRWEGCALVLLNDPSVSRQHGRITYENGIYFYQDTSSNGTRLVNQFQDINNQSIALNGGEILGVGEYQLECILETTEPKLSNTSLVESSSALSSSVSQLSHDHGEDYGVSPILLTGILSENSPSGSDPFMDMLLGIDTLSCDDGSDQTSGGEPEIVADDSAPVTYPQPAQTDNRTWTTSIESYHAFLRGAGLHDGACAVQNPEELTIRMEQVGRLLRAFVEGITLALQTRAELKRQIRLSITTLEAANNNPLKFSSNTTHVLELILNSDGQGFKDSVLAVKEGFDDLVAHQLAMNAGIQGSLLGVFKRFDPLIIESGLDRALVIQKKAKCWDEYCKKYPLLVATALEDIFGDDFEDVYERQLEKLHIKKTE